ncbi:recombinase family protein [Haloarchaeobius sp. HRN-SO-5]|uniref:recombinase family protein n=1 Tax=Haloarchaeobius sp. HRN-SO-5 TaxID=3446118 RepID=UPI003EBD299F
MKTPLHSVEPGSWMCSGIPANLKQSWICDGQSIDARSKIFVESNEGGAVEQEEAGRKKSGLAAASLLPQLSSLEPQAVVEQVVSLQSLKLAALNHIFSWQPFPEALLPEVLLPFLIGLLGLGAVVQSELAEERFGAIYVRVSTNAQVKEGKSIEEQISSLRKIAEEENITLVCEPIVDGGKTGTNFERDGIKEVIDLAVNREINYILVDDLDRLGRLAPDIVYLIWGLRKDFDVTIFTNESGEVDIETMEGLAVVFIKAFCAHFETENKSRRSKNVRRSNFKQNSWKSLKSTIPIGYEKEGDWIKIDSKNANQLRLALWKFYLADIDSGPYKVTSEVLKRWYPDVDGHKAKKLLQDPVLIGLPTAGGGERSFHETRGAGVTVSDPDLRIISTEFFARIQKKIEQIYKKNSSNDSDPEDVNDFICEFGLFTVKDVFDCVELVCPSTVCPGKLVKNGVRNTEDRVVHNYTCNHCGRSRKLPTKRQLQDLQRRAKEDDDK